MAVALLSPDYIISIKYLFTLLVSLDQFAATSKTSDCVEKLVNNDGAILNIDNVIMDIGPGCLAENTLIKLVKVNNYDQPAFKNLLDLGLVNEVLCTLQCLPRDLKFLKPANLELNVKSTTLIANQTFVLHGSYLDDTQTISWELVTNDVNVDVEEGKISINIHGFSFYTYILATYSFLRRILCHLNRSFTSRACVFYRRLRQMGTFDISIVFISEFVAEKPEKEIRQFEDHISEGFMKGEMGMRKTVNTSRSHQMSLEFPGKEIAPYIFQMDEAELDFHGFIVDHFKGQTIDFPAKGFLNVNEVNPEDGSHKLLWHLPVCEAVEPVITPKNKEGNKSTF